MLARTTLLPLALTICAVTLAACANDDDRVATPATSTPAATAPPTAAASPVATPAGAGAMQGGSAGPAQADAQGDGTALLTDVRTAAQDGYDRVVFEFAGDPVPGYTVAYAAEITEDGSGATVDLAGDAALTVRMSPAADADLSKADAPMTYTGPRRMKPATDEVVELARVGGFEGVLTWAIGVRARTAFSVSTLTDPARVIVDIRRP
jgi:hypothetical protein